MNNHTASAQPVPASGAPFVLEDLSVASAFLRLTEKSAIRMTRQEYEVARETYDAVASHVMQATLTRAEHERIVGRMRVLARRLRDFELRNAS